MRVSELSGQPKPALGEGQATETLSLSELMLKFESLGENCEFGLVQRRGGAEPLGLLRFSSSPLAKLLAALAGRFEGLGRPDTIKVELSGNGREYMVLDQKFGLYYHAWVLVDEKPADEVYRRELRRLPYLTRKLAEDLADGEKIFVYHNMSPLNEAQIGRLVEQVRSYGPSTVLWMEKADANNPANSVKWIGPGLLRGNLARFAPGEDAHGFDFDGWVEVCSKAYELWMREKAAA